MSEQEIAQYVRDNLWWMLLIAGGIFLLADVGVLLWLRRGGMEKLEEQLEEDDEPDSE